MLPLLLLLLYLLLLLLLPLWPPPIRLPSLLQLLLLHLLLLLRTTEARTMPPHLAVVSPALSASLRSMQRPWRNRCNPLRLLHPLRRHRVHPRFMSPQLWRRRRCLPPGLLVLRLQRLRSHCHCRPLTPLSNPTPSPFPLLLRLQPMAQRCSYRQRWSYHDRRRCRHRRRWCQRRYCCHRWCHRCCRHLR